VNVGRVMVIGRETRYALDDSRIKSLWRARYSTAVQTDPGSHTSSSAMGNVSLSHG